MQGIRYAAKVDLKKPAAEQATLHVGVYDVKRQHLAHLKWNRWHPDSMSYNAGITNFVMAES